MTNLPEPEVWSPETIAEFHLNNAMGEEDYRDAIAEVLAMGIDPTSLNPDHVIIGDKSWRHPELYIETIRAKQNSRMILCEPSSTQTFFFPLPENARIASSPSGPSPELRFRHPSIRSVR